MSVFLTGDIHGDIYPRFNTKNFPAQKELTKEDFVIVLGDFGIPWCNDITDHYHLKELEHRPWTTLFLDGNHENFDLLNQFPTETWNGGTVHRLNDSVLHLMRGQVFTLNGASFFTFGGAASHDIQDGILEPTDPAFHQKVKRLNREGKRFWRVNHVSWWKEEMPNQEEFQTGMANLEKHNFQTDFILTHCPPNTILSQMGYSNFDDLSTYLQDVYQKTSFQRWYFGHMHTDQPFYWDRCIGMYETITQIL